MHSELNLPKNLNVDEEKHYKYKELAESDLFNQFSAPMKEVFMYAMALGFNNKLLTPLSRKKGSIPSNTFSDNQKWLINSIAISKVNSLEALVDVENVVRIAEEYANGGIDDLYDSLVVHVSGDSYKAIDNAISEYLRKDFEDKKTEAETSTEESVSEKLLIDYINGGESEYVEFKSSLLWDYVIKSPRKEIAIIVVRSIVCFLNSRKGGTLLIGIADNKEILGLEPDFIKGNLRKPDEDGFELKINDLIDTCVGKVYRQYVHVKFEKIDEKTVCILTIEKAPTPAYFNNSGKNEFYVRTGNSCHQFDVKDANDWIRANWGLA